MACGAMTTVRRFLTSTWMCGVGTTSERSRCPVTSTQPAGSPNLWTRSQRIRTAAEAPFEVALIDTAEVLLYQKIAPQAQHILQLGLSFSYIAKHLGVTDKTVAKAVSWHNSRFRPPIYPQLWGAFRANLSALDLLCNCGLKSHDILALW